MPNLIIKITIKKLILLLSILISQLTFHETIAISKNNDFSFGWNQATFQHQQLERDYRYYIPSTKIKNPPLVILLHGGTQNMYKLFNKHAGGSKEWQSLADEYGFILMTPNGTNAKSRFTKSKKSKLNWNDCRTKSATTRRNVESDDIGFIKNLIHWSKKNLSINPKKIFVAGASNGGMMSYRVASELSNEVTAVAAFIANLPENSECKLPKKPIPMLIMNGTDDIFMPWNGGEVKGKGGKVMSTADTLEFWLLGNNSDKNNPIKKRFKDVSKKDHSRVNSTCFPARTNTKRASSKTCLYEIVGGGHVTPSIKHEVPKWIQKRIIGWQNQDIEGARIAWDFFEKY